MIFVRNNKKAFECCRALKKIVEELQEYSQLQERWVLTHTQIGLERACGFTVTPPADNLRSLWKAVEHQVWSSKIIILISYK